MGTNVVQRAVRASRLISRALLFLAACVTHDAIGEETSKCWSPGDPISVCLSSPAHGQTVVQGGSLACRATAGDTDWWAMTNEQNETILGAEGDSPLTFNWSAYWGGHSSSASGASVTWTAPTNYVGSVTIRVRVNDPSGTHVPSGDTGTRNDSEATSSVTIYVVPPPPPPPPPPDDGGDGGGGGGDDGPTDWAPDEGIHPFEGTSVIPEDGQVVEVGEECLVAAFYGDLDLATLPSGDTYHESDPRTFTIQASAGTFPDGSSYSSSVGTWGVVWKAPDTPQTVQFTITIDDAEGPHVPAGDTGSRDDPAVTVTINVIVAAVNLLADANNNGVIDAGDDTDAVEENWGRLVGYNGDDDDGNAQRDKDDTTVLNEDDLAAVTLTASPGIPNGYTISLWQSNWTSSEILRLWQAPSKGTPVALLTSTPDADLNPLHVIGNGDLPSPLHVEGYRDSYRTFLHLRLLDPDGHLVAKDKVRFTPVELRPRAAGRGTTVTVFLNADNLDWGDVADISFGEGITVVARTDEDHVEISIAPDAPAGKRDVQIRPDAVLRNGFRVVGFDIAGDVNGDGAIDASPGSQDVAWEDQEPGLIVGVNDNDSDGNGYRDMDNAIIDGENDLADMRKIQIKLEPSGFEGHVVLSLDSSDAAHIRVFGDAPWNEAQPIIGPNAGCAHTITVTGDATTLTFHAEALAGGKVLLLKCEWLDTLGTELAEDEIRVSTVGSRVPGGWYVGSLHTFAASPEFDDDGEPIAEYVGVTQGIDEDHPGQAVVDMRPFMGKSCLSAAMADALANGADNSDPQAPKLFIYMEGSTTPCISFRDDIVNSPEFQFTYGAMQALWQAASWVLGLLGYTDEQIEAILGPPPTADGVYAYLRSQYSVDEGEEKYLWVTPRITAYGKYTLTVRTSPNGKALKTFKLTVLGFGLYLDEACTEKLDDWLGGGDQLWSPKFVLGSLDRIWAEVRGPVEEPVEVRLKTESMGSQPGYVVQLSRQGGADRWLSTKPILLGASGENTPEKVVLPCNNEELLETMFPADDSFPGAMNLIMVDHAEFATTHNRYTAVPFEEGFWGLIGYNVVLELGSHGWHGRSMPYPPKEADIRQAGSGSQADIFSLAGHGRPGSGMDTERCAAVLLDDTLNPGDDDIQVAPHEPTTGVGSLGYTWDAQAGAWLRQSPALWDGGIANAWGHDIDWVMLSACRCLRDAMPAVPTQGQALHGKDTWDDLLFGQRPAHGIFGFADSPSVGSLQFVASGFLSRARSGQALVDAWIAAVLDCPGATDYGIVMHAYNAGDRLSKPTPDTRSSAMRYWSSSGRTSNTPINYDDVIAGPAKARPATVTLSFTPDPRPGPARLLEAELNRVRVAPPHRARQRHGRLECEYDWPEYSSPTPLDAARVVDKHFSRPLSKTTQREQGYDGITGQVHSNEVTGEIWSFEYVNASFPIANSSRGNVLDVSVKQGVPWRANGRVYTPNGWLDDSVQVLSQEAAVRKVSERLRFGAYGIRGASVIRGAKLEYECRDKRPASGRVILHPTWCVDVSNGDRILRVYVPAEQGDARGE